MAESVGHLENKDQRNDLIHKEGLVISIKKEVDVLVKPEPHECVVCVARSKDSYDIFCTTTSASGASLHSFLSKYTDNELGNAQQCPKYVCKSCFDLINVLEQAEIEYKKLKDTFEAIISKNPLFNVNSVQPIQLASVKNELVGQVNVAFDDYDMDSEDEPLSLTKKKRRKPAKKRKKTTPVKRKTKVKASLDESYNMDMLDPMDQPLIKRKKNWKAKIKLVSNIMPVAETPAAVNTYELPDMEKPSASVQESDIINAYDLHDVKDIPLSDIETNESEETVPCELTIIRPPHNSKPRIRPIKTSKLTSDLNFGSEEDSDDDDDRYAMSTLLSVPRIVRDVYIDDDEQPFPEETEPVHATESPSLLLRPTQPSPLLTSEKPQYKPIDPYDFQWRPFPDPPILRRESFLDSNTGPKCVYDKPYVAFTAIWDHELMSQICTQTNLYAKQYVDKMKDRIAKLPKSRVHSWKDITVDELYVYFAMILAMGCVAKSRMHEYWSKNEDIFRTPGFPVYMALNRFMVINKFLHFNDNSLINTEKMTHAQAKLHKVQPLVDRLNEKFSELYTLDRHIALDESLTEWKNCLKLNQFITHKSALVDIKTHEVCESRTGYLWRLKISANSETSQDSDSVLGAVPSIVLELLKGLENKGHTIWMDNYYNSPALARTLKALKFDCVGTLRISRQFVPRALVTLQGDQMVRGEIAGCTSGDVDLLVWKDKKRVGLISTYHGIDVTQTGETQKPTLIHDYNFWIRGLDKRDQKLAMFPIERKKFKVWYKKFFRRLLNVSVLNAFIMFKHHSVNAQHHEFRIELIRNLLELHHKQPGPSHGLKLFKLKDTKQYIFTAEALKHLPAELGWFPGGARMRRKCFLCKTRTYYCCPGCNKPLCSFKSNQSDSASSSATCFSLHHSKN